MPAACCNATAAARGSEATGSAFASNSALSPPVPAPTTGKGRGTKRKVATDDDGDSISVDEGAVPPPAKVSKKRTAGPPATVTGSNPPARSSSTTITNAQVNPLVTSGNNDPWQLNEPDEDLPPQNPHSVANAWTTTERRSTPSSETAVVDPHLAQLLERYKVLESDNRRLFKYKTLWAQEHEASQGLSDNDEDDEGDEDDEHIPRPPGERGKNGWNMQEALRLENDGHMYNAILASYLVEKATTRDTVVETGLKWKLKFDEQDPARLANCYNQMKLRHGYLKRFKNDWACRELVIGVLQNRRKSENAKARSKVAPKGPSKVSKRKGFKPRSASASVPPEEAESANMGDGESAWAGSQ